MGSTAIAIGESDGHVDIADCEVSPDLATPKPDGTPGKPNATNPEALFAAGSSAGYGQATIALAGKKRVTPAQVKVTARVALSTENNDDRLSVVLRSGTTGNGRAQAEELAHKAHEVCRYSNATRNNIPVTIEVQ